MDDRRNLVTICVNLLTKQLSDFHEDYSFKIPNHHIRKITAHNDFLRLCAIRIKEIWKDNDTQVTALQEQVKELREATKLMRSWFAELDYTKAYLQGGEDFLSPVDDLLKRTET